MYQALAPESFFWVRRDRHCKVKNITMSLRYRVCDVLVDSWLYTTNGILRHLTRAYTRNIRYTNVFVRGDYTYHEKY